MKMPPVLILTALLQAGCITAPAVTMIDRKTAFEIQAQGDFRALENRLVDSAVEPGPLALTKGQIESAGEDVSRSDFDKVVRLYSSLKSDGALIDELLVRRCIGEALDGLLTETPDNCKGEVDATSVSTIIQRVNRNRRQLWVWMMRQGPGSSEDRVRAAWRKTHVRAVVCGGQVQGEDGQWVVKECGE